MQTNEILKCRLRSAVIRHGAEVRKLEEVKKATNDMELKEAIVDAQAASLQLIVQAKRKLYGMEIIA